MDRRNVCIFSANYYPFLGGVEIFTKNLSSALVQEGCSVTVVTNNATGLPLHEVTLEGIEIYRLPCLPVLRGRMPIPLKNAAWHDAVHTIMERHWDCILVNTRFYLHSLLGLRVAENQHLTPIVCEHGSAYLSMGNRFADVFVRLWEHIVTAAVKRYKPAFCAVSQKAADWLSTFGISCDTVLSNSIDAVAYRKSSSGRNFREELGLADDDFIVCFVGRFVPEKGVTKLVEAMESIKDPEVKLILAGDGPLRGKVDSCAGNSIFNVGRLQSADVAALMLQSNLLCLPTRSEGFCTTLLESAASPPQFPRASSSGLSPLLSCEYPHFRYIHQTESSHQHSFAKNQAFYLHPRNSSRMLPFLPLLFLSKGSRPSTSYFSGICPSQKGHYSRFHHTIPVSFPPKYFERFA